MVFGFTRFGVDLLGHALGSSGLVGFAWVHSDPPGDLYLIRVRGCSLPRA